MCDFCWPAPQYIEDQLPRKKRVIRAKCPECGGIMMPTNSPKVQRCDNWPRCKYMTLPDMRGLEKPIIEYVLPDISHRKRRSI